MKVKHDMTGWAWQMKMELNFQSMEKVESWDRQWNNKSDYRVTDGRRSRRKHLEMLSQNTYYEGRC